MWRPSPVVKTRLAIPAGKSARRESREETSNLCHIQAASPDIDCSRVRLSLDGGVGVVNVSSLQRMIDALRDSMAEGHILECRVSVRMKARRFGGIQWTANFGAPGILLRANQGHAEDEGARTK